MIKITGHGYTMALISCQPDALAEHFHPAYLRSEDSRALRTYYRLGSDSVHIR